ncbi:hypothetical protein AAMO2058_000305600 [Amorphochlora amoebiformis]
MATSRYSWLRPKKGHGETWRRFHRRLAMAVPEIWVVGGCTGEGDMLPVEIFRKEHPTKCSLVPCDLKTSRSIWVAREGAALAVTKEERVVCIGGWHGVAPISTGFEAQFSSDSMELRKLPILNTPRCYSAAACVGDVLLCAGGSESPYANDGDVYSSTEFLRFGAKEWLEGPKLSHVRSGHAVALTPQGNRLLAVGGYGGGNTFLQSMEMLDFTRGGGLSWVRDERRMRCKRTGLGLAVGPGHCLYAVGGSCNGATMLSTVERLDLREPKWHKLASMAAPRGYCSAAFDSSGFLYAVGGLQDLSHHPLATLERYDPRADKWETVDGTLRFGRHSHAIAISLPGPR